ncbi:MAG: hypothetical protein PHD21_03355 [Flavobacteriales bacterium]|nr:hypothetical protein [Flavobacteriales bacterium]
MPALAKIYNKIDKNHFELINISTGKKDIEHWKKLSTEKGIIWTNVLQIDKENQRASALYEISGTPYAYAIDSIGYITDKGDTEVLLEKAYSQESSTSLISKIIMLFLLYISPFFISCVVIAAIATFITGII